MPICQVMKAAAVSTTQTIELTFPSSERFALSRVAATAAVIVAVMALASDLRAARFATDGFIDDEIPRPSVADGVTVWP